MTLSVNFVFRLSQKTRPIGLLFYFFIFIGVENENTPPSFFLFLPSRAQFRPFFAISLFFTFVDMGP